MRRTKLILLSQIETEFLGCPYCGNDVSRFEPWQGCCGESSAHFVNMIATTQGETFLESEIETIDDETGEVSK